MKTKITIVNGPAQGEFQLEHPDEEEIGIGREFTVRGPDGLGHSDYRVLAFGDNGWHAAMIESMPTMGFSRTTKDDTSQPRSNNHSTSIDTNTSPFVTMGLEFNMKRIEGREWFGVLLHYGAEKQEIANALEKLVAALRSEDGGVKDHGDRVGREVNRSDYPDAI